MTGGRGKVGMYLKKLGVADLEVDVTDESEVERAIKRQKPQVIIHLASVSDVDFCQKKENWKKVASVNLVGTSNVARIARHNNVGVVLLSTVQVFDGKKWWGKYRETDSPNAINQYGLSKMAAEALLEEFENLKVVRTSRLFDVGCISVSDIGHPTFIERSYMYLGHFANSITMYANRFYSMPTILHIAGSKTASEYEFMLAVAEIYGYNKSEVLARKKNNKEYAPRPKRGGLDVNRSKMLGLPQYDYLEGLLQMRRDLS